MSGKRKRDPKVKTITVDGPSFRQRVPVMELKSTGQTRWVSVKTGRTDDQVVRLTSLSGHIEVTEMAADGTRRVVPIPITARLRDSVEITPYVWSDLKDSSDGSR